MSLTENEAEAVRWLLIQGLVPLFGAGMLYSLWGGVRFVSATQKRSFSYAWREAIDAMGWLYGASTLAIQTASLSHSMQNYTLTGLSIAGAAVSLLLLLSAMTDRGATPHWQPDLSLKVVAGGLVLAILTAGYKAHLSAYQSVHQIHR